MPEVASTTIRLLLEAETEGLIGGTIPINGMSKTLRRSSNAAAEAVLHATTINFTLLAINLCVIANALFRISGSGRLPYGK